MVKRQGQSDFQVNLMFAKAVLVEGVPGFL